MFTSCSKQRSQTFTMMLWRIYSACLFLSVLSGGSSLSCTWMDQKFTQYSEHSLILLDAMGRTEDAGAEDALLPFPYNLYQQASKASVEDKLAFTVQILREVSALFEEDYSAASWEESAVENFLNIVNKQADELSSCIVSQHRTRKVKKIHMYFKRLLHQVLEQRSSNAAAWELVKREIKLHLIQVELVSSAQ